MINNNESLLLELESFFSALSCLRNCGVVKVEKNGKYSEYSINGEDVKEIIFIATRHAKNYGKSILSCDIIKEEKENR
jgi:hypothetical protein